MLKFVPPQIPVCNTHDTKLNKIDTEQVGQTEFIKLR